MSDRPTAPDDLPAADTEVVESGNCRILTDCRLCTVGLDNGYHGHEFTAGEVLPYDRLLHRLSRGQTSTAYVIDAGDTGRGRVYLLPVLWERYCEVVTASKAVVVEAVKHAGQQVAATVRPVRVVNVKGLNKPEQRQRVVYVGRKFAGWPGHPLCNTPPREDEPIEDCLARYKARLMGRLTLEAELAALWAETGQGVRPLGCWCTNAVVGDGSAVVCHAQTLAAMLTERFGGK